MMLQLSAFFSILPAVVAVTISRSDGQQGVEMANLDAHLVINYQRTKNQITKSYKQKIICVNTALIFCFPDSSAIFY